MDDNERLVEGLPPFVFADTKILILGSFPSVKSRAEEFYYMHPQNRFYKVLDRVFNVSLYDASINDKKTILKKLHIGLFDTVKSCYIKGSSDLSIHNYVVNDLRAIIKDTKIKMIITNGKLSEKIFKKNFDDLVYMACFLPSTSPANAQFSLEKLVEIWSNALLND